MTEDKRKIPVKHFAQLALSPEQREAFRKLALPPAQAEAFKRIAARSRGPQPHVQEVRDWLAREKREIAARQQVVSEVEALLQGESGINPRKPPAASHKQKPTPKSRSKAGPQQDTIARALRELRLDPEGKRTSTIQNEIRRWVENEIKRTGKKIAIPSWSSVARHLGRRKVI